MPGERNLTLQSRLGLTQLHLNANIIIWTCSTIVNWLQSNADKSISHDLLDLFHDVLSIYKCVCAGHIERWHHYWRQDVS